MCTGPLPCVFIQEFTRSYLRDLRMQSRDQSDWAVSRLNTLATRRRSVLTDMRSKDALSDIGCVWDLDMHTLKEKVPRPLVDGGFLLLSPFAVSPDVSINPQVLRKFLVEVEKAYKPNPYHNSTHGITATAAARCPPALPFTMECPLKFHVARTLFATELSSSSFASADGFGEVVGRNTENRLGDLEEVGLIIASLCHDIAHPGRNNNFMVNASTPLALTYNDISVLENMHASLTFRLLCDRRLNLLGHLHREAFRTCRKLMIDLILSTDMKTHFDQIANFRLRRQSEGFDPVNNDEDRQRLLEMVIKSADIGHGALPWPAHEQWCLLVVQEFYDQGDEEKRLGLPVSFLCDRSQHDTEFFKSQIGFLDFVVKPLYEELEAVEGMLDYGPERPVRTICVQNLANNIAQWKAKEEGERRPLVAHGSSGAEEKADLPE
ncbi:3 5 -cyclic nucleotide phosphodiesterase domain-containing protein [Cystoisospora suis]|uniref:Phosphodiesterase n=1 Tax=Cystoisospora suis TaxID=483139 RepID=A0A2C6KNF7_9APIC|nr:3 5 -cyclic nucleotide phosphodiesterase domain-containing protein [Cystoisospora suis]